MYACTQIHILVCDSYIPPRVVFIITVKCKVELHTGAVKLYNLYISQGRKRWVPIASFDSVYEVKDLESGTTYNFYIEHQQFKSETITATTKPT